MGRRERGTGKGRKGREGKRVRVKGRREAEEGKEGKVKGR